MVGDYKSAQTDSVAKTIDLMREECALFKFRSDDSFFEKTENKSGMVVVLSQRSRDDDYIVQINKGILLLN